MTVAVRRPETYYDADNKLCQRCGGIKSRDQFGRSGRGWQSHCIPCRNEYRKELRKLHPERAHRADRRNNLRRNYRLTPEEWETMFASQGSACAICRSLETRGRGWHTDHCHEGGAVRGILCHDCNVALGYYEKTILPNFAAFDAWRRHVA